MANEEKALGVFQPVARYYSAMDFMLYMSEDCSYRADRIDPYLTVLLHPQENRVVGIKLKRVRFLFERVKAIVGLKDSDFLPLVKALEVALTTAMATAQTQIEQSVLREKYAQARQIANGVQVHSDEWSRALAA